MRIKTHPITAVLTSAYLSAMLTSSLAPIRNNTIFAAAVDPTAAEKALQNAVSGLDAAGWAAAATPSPAQTAPEPVPVKVTPKTDPVMTDELMARLLKFTSALEITGKVDSKICKILELCDGTQHMPLKLAESEPAPGGHHYFGTPLDAESTDILIIVKNGPVIEAYLTDKTRKLRAAAVLTDGVARLILNEKAVEKFKAELTIWAGEALTLPPTGTAVAGNS